MSRALSQIGHADYRSTNYTGFPSELDEQPEPVGDAEADCDNDEAFRQSSLDRMDFTPRQSEGSDQRWPVDNGHVVTEADFRWFYVQHGK